MIISGGYLISSCLLFKWDDKGSWDEHAALITVLVQEQRRQMALWKKPEVIKHEHLQTQHSVARRRRPYLLHFVVLYFKT